VINPLRSEAEAFRFLLYAIGTVATIVALVLIIRAIF
jgi:bacteriorhodopsin